MSKKNIVSKPRFPRYAYAGNTRGLLWDTLMNYVGYLFGRKLPASGKPVRIRPDGRIERRRKPDVDGLSEELLHAQESERERISHDLHDSIGQNLSAIKMAIETALTLDAGEEERPGRLMLINALERIRSTSDDLRRIAHGLRPSMLDDLGLLASLGCLCREFRDTNPGVTLRQYIVLAEKDIPEQLRCDLYRLVQEALHNVIKHANADQVEIRLVQLEEGILLNVNDNGDGFDLEQRLGNGIGLNSMRARSERTGGQLLIDTCVGAGTRVSIFWPRPLGDDGQLVNGY